MANLGPGKEGCRIGCPRIAAAADSGDEVKAFCGVENAGLRGSIVINADWPCLDVLASRQCCAFLSSRLCSCRLVIGVGAHKRDAGPAAIAITRKIVR